MSLLWLEVIRRGLGVLFLTVFYINWLLLEDWE